MGRTRGAGCMAFLLGGAFLCPAQEVGEEAAPLPRPAVARLGGSAWKPGVAIDGVEWSADDARVTVRSWEEAVVVDASTGRILGRSPWKDPRRSRFGEGESLEVDSPDGTRRASVGRNAPLRILDRKSGETRDSGRIPTTYNVTWDPARLAWSPDGALVAVGGDDGVLSVCDGRTGALLYQRRSCDSRMPGLAWSPDGKRIATGGSGKFVWATENSGGDDGIVRIYAAADGKELFTLKGHERSVDGVAWSPDGTRLLSWSEGEARLWDPSDGRLVADLEAGKGYRSVANGLWSPDGKRILTGGNRDRLRVFDGVTGALQGEMEVPGGAPGFAWSHGGDRIASGGFQGALWIHDAETGRVLSPHGGHTGQVHGAAWSPNGRTLATAGEDGAVLLWDGTSFALLRPLRSPTACTFRGVAWAPEGARLAASRSDGGVSVFDPATGAEVALLLPPPVEGERGVGASGTLAWSPDGRVLAVCGEDPQVRLWDVPAMGLLRVLESTAGSVDGPAWSPDGKVLRAHGQGSVASLSSSGDLLAWDAASGAPCPWKEAGTRRLGVMCAAWSPDGARGVTQEEDGTVRLWEAATGRCLRHLNGPLGGGSAAAFSHDGAWIATGCASGLLVLYDTATLARLFAFQAHGSEVGIVAWSPAGDRLASAAGTEAPMVWDLYPAPRPDPSRPPLPPPGPERGAFLGRLWNRLGDPRLEEGLQAEEAFAALGAPAAAFSRERLVASGGGSPRRPTSGRCGRCGPSSGRGRRRGWRSSVSWRRAQPTPPSAPPRPPSSARRRPGGGNQRGSGISTSSAGASKVPSTRSPSPTHARSRTFPGSRPRMRKEPSAATGKVGPAPAAT